MATRQFTVLMGLALAGAMPGAGAASMPGAGPALFAATDSEGFSSTRVALNYLPAYNNRYEQAGVRLGASRFAQDGWRRDGQQLLAVYHSVAPATLDGVQLEGGLSRQGEHSLLAIDANWHATLAPRRSVELFLNRDWVETRRALEQGVAFAYAGGALEQGLGEHLTLVGMAGYQDFSDGNKRRHGRFKAIYQPSLALGLTLQARYRVFHGDADSVRTYFNPARYDETMLALGFRKRVQGWMGNLTAGVGRQRVGADGRTPTRLLELGLESPQHQRQSVRIKAGFNQSASFGGPDYRYRYAQAEWLIGF
jgi:hypothetical protein